jgi:LmbE family N-acetylglucosaminyl deacetylase
VPAAEAVGRLRAIAEEVQPDTVLTFGPDGATWHPDHMAVSRWTAAAVDGTGAALHYNSTTPEWIAFSAKFIDPAAVMMADREPLVHPVDALSIHTVLDGDLLEAKYRAMLCQESQVAPMLAAFGPDNFRQLLAEEAFRPAGHDAVP